jgi:predicted NBD/HSP70 family sugar kinase
MPASIGHGVVREANTYAVLRLIADHAPVTRSRIVELSGLSRPTILSIVAELEHDELIVAEKIRAGAVGRAPVFYRPNPAAAHVVGADLGGSRLRVAIADLSGRFVGESAEPTDRRGGQRVIGQLQRAARRVAEEANVPWESVQTVTVGTPGVLAADGSVQLAGNIPGLHRLDVLGTLRAGLECDVAVENDVNVAALGEHVFGIGRKFRSLALVAIGTGVGLGIIMDGELVRGARGRAGELAYLPIGGDPSTPEALKRGALELAMSGSGFRRLAARYLGAGDGPVGDGHDPLAPEAVMDRAAGGDPAAIETIARYAEVVAGGILSVAAILDPEVVLLGGGIGSNPLLLEPTKRALRRIAPFTVSVQPSRLGSRAGLAGAIADARRRALRAVFDTPGQMTLDEVDRMFQVPISENGDTPVELGEATPVAPVATR